MKTVRSKPPWQLSLDETGALRRFARAAGGGLQLDALPHPGGRPQSSHSRDSRVPAECAVTSPWSSFGMKAISRFALSENFLGFARKLQNSGADSGY